MAVVEELKVKVEIPKEEIRRIMKDVAKEYAEGMPDELWGVVNDFVSTMRRNMEIANNTYTQMGYEIALDVLKSILEDRGYKTADFFPEEVDDDDIF